MDLWNESEKKLAVFDAFAVVVKAMANGRRLELVELLAQGEHSVDALSRKTRMGVTTTSAHLQTLRHAGLVRTRRQGSMVIYRLAGDDVAELFVAAKKVGLLRSADLRDTVAAYLGNAEDGDTVPSIDPGTVTAGMTILDVRPRSEFNAGHFPGALSVPLAELPDRYTEIPAGTEVVVYCRGQFCRYARQAAHWLRGRGIDAKAMDDGVIEWRTSEQVHLEPVTEVKADSDVA